MYSIADKLNQIHATTVEALEIVRSMCEQMEKYNAVIVPVEITTEMVRELRQRTGDGMMACLKALRHSDGNMQKAVDYLRCSGNISLTDNHWIR